MECFTTAFLAHLAYGHCGDAAMQLTAHAPELYGDVLTGMRGQCEGCHLVGQVERNQGKLHNCPDFTLLLLRC